MAEKKVESPFSGLDKALLRSTQPRRQEQVTEQPERASIQTTAQETSSRQREDLASNNESPPASPLASSTASAEHHVIETIRKTVKASGKEVSFIRLTPQEKGQLADIVYTYKRLGIKTTETEINRIAVNHMLLDYHEHGENSVLARVIEALRA